MRGRSERTAPRSNSGRLLGRQPPRAAKPSLSSAGSRSETSRSIARISTGSSGRTRTSASTTCSQSGTRPTLQSSESPWSSSGKGMPTRTSSTPRCPASDSVHSVPSASVTNASTASFPVWPIDPKCGPAPRRGGPATQGRGLEKAATQASSDQPDLVAFYDQFFRRQGSFPILSRSLA